MVGRQPSESLAEPTRASPFHWSLLRRPRNTCRGTGSGGGTARGTGRVVAWRSAVGANAALQTALAFGLLIAVNVYSFLHSARFDLTRERVFSLPASVINELRPLHSGMTIVILQQHKTFGQLSASPDQYDYAAEKEVVEKIKDRIEKFREVGPRFKVHVLDVEEKDFDKKVGELTKLRPGLREAMRTAPDNSIFFYSDADVTRWKEPEVLRLNPPLRQKDPEVPGSFLVYQSFIQRLSFNEFYLLDKTASKSANGNEGNLVLQPQGLSPVLARITANQEKKPKVALASVHEALSSSTSDATPDEYSHNGLRKTLEEHGFEVVDLILKKFEPREVKAVAYNIVENRAERLANRLRGISNDINGQLDDQITLGEQIDRFKNLEEGERKRLALRLKRQPTEKEVEDAVDDFKKNFRDNTGREFTEDDRKKLIETLSNALAEVQEELPKLEEKRQQANKELQETYKDERALEDRRVTDLEAKMNRLLEDVDLLIIPRPTLINIHAGMMIPANLFALRDKEENEFDARMRGPKAMAKQVKVIRDFIKRGKPVLACFGPTNQRRGGPMNRPLDDMEKIIADLGIELSRKTIIYNAEEADFDEDDSEDSFGTGGNSEIPDAVFRAPFTPGSRIHPIAEAMRIARRTVDQDLKIRLRHPRPIYLQPGLSELHPDAEFLFSSKDCWNENIPFPVIKINQLGQIISKETPRFHPNRGLTDSRKSPHDVIRRGPFPIGMALEERPPIEWYDEKFIGYKDLSGMVTSWDQGVFSTCVTATALLKKKGDKLIPRDDRPLTRIVVIGHGGLFSGKKLSPATEKFLLNTCNWLLHREDRLPRSASETSIVAETKPDAMLEAEKPWQFPRVAMDNKTKSFWHWGTFIGIPAIFAYLGLVVLMFRRIR